MTTIAANLKEVASDSRVTWEGVGSDIYSSIKIFPTSNGKPAIYGVTGGDCTGSIRALEWLQGVRDTATKPSPPDYEHSWDWKLIELSSDGLAIYNEYLEREMCTEPMLAVGSGRKVALYCMKYLHMSPAEAVREACKVDHWSEVPIYVCRLDDLKVVRWTPAKKKIVRVTKPKETENAPSQS
jgi:hypothetical protein